MTKRILFLLILLLPCPSLFAWDILSGITGSSFWGTPLILIPYGTEPGATPTIEPAKFQPGGDGPGMVVANTNLFTGQPVYSIPLGGVNAHGLLSFPITLTYGGPTKPIVESDNQRAPVGWIGLGWDLSIPYVAVNHKGTLTTSDDVIMCNLGPYGGGQILQNPTSKAYYVSTNPYIKILAETGTYDSAVQFIRWTFTLPDGKRMVFGDNANSTRTVFRTGNVIKASAYALPMPKHFIYRWDLSYITDANSANKILFDYQQEMESSGPSGSYVRESHILNIKWTTPGNSEVERYHFTTANQAANEYAGYQSDGSEPRDNQKLFEQKRLDTLHVFKEGVETHYFKFLPGPSLVADWDGYPNKRLLQEIQVYVKRNGSNVKDNGWKFAYGQNGEPNYPLSSITTPDLRTDSYTYSSPYFPGSNADQDRQTYNMLQSDNTTPVSLPSDNTKKLLWKPQSVCDERFCYLTVKDRDGIDPDAQGRTQKLYVEIHPNMGNYFDNNPSTGTFRAAYGDATTPADSLDMIPGGDFFLLVNRVTGNITLYAWDGLNWQLTKPFAGDPRYNATNDSFGHHIRIFMGGNYFLVQKTSVLSSGGVGTPTELIPVIRKPDGSWASLNQLPTACQIDDKSDYGEPVRASRTSGSCMEFNSDQLLVTASPNFYTVTHQGVDVMLFYALNQAGTGFTEMTKKLPVVAGAQISGYPMNWQDEILSVTAAADYFVVGTYHSTYSLQVMYFNGDSIYDVVELPKVSALPQVWLSNDYFIEKGPDFRFWQKRVSSTGSVTFVRGSSALPFDFPNNVPAAFPVVRTHSSAFSIEYYASPDSIGTRPLLSSNGLYYSVGLFQVNRTLTGGEANRTPQLVSNGNRLFNISFSPSDNQIFALAGQNSSGGPCGSNQSCTFQYYSVRTHPANPIAFIDPAKDLNSISITLPTVLRQTQAVLSNAGRIALLAYLNPASQHVEFNYLQWNSDGYDAPDNYQYVSGFTSASGLSTADKDNIHYDINCYDNAPTWSMDLNSNTQNLEFESCEVRHSTPSYLADMGATRYVFNVDVRSHPLYGKNAALKGQLLASSSYSTGSDTVYKANSAPQLAHNSAWPTCLYVTRPYKQTTKVVASNQSYQVASTSFHGYNDNNGAPAFTVQGLGLGPHRVSQTLFDSKFLPTQSITFAAASYPDTGSLKSASATTPLNSQSPFTSLKPITSSKSVTDANFRFQHSEVWRDIDAALTPAGMKTGNTPTFNLSENWITTQEITQWNRFNQPLESRAPRSTQAADSVYSAFFYEGQRSDPVAVVSNAKLENCAVLTAENYNAGFSTLDEPGKWQTSSAVSYSSAFAHTGRYSLKVVDNYGPTINRVLKDVTRYHYGYRVSGWIYATTGTTPVLTIERRRADNTIASYIAGAPLQGSFPANQWVRWEANISYADLTAGGLFTTSAADYLRIYFGTGGPTGNSAKVVYVDDLVLTPSNATFSLASYDGRGLRTSATGSNHITTFFDLNARGETTAVRDENFRIHGQTGVHRMGEN